MNVQFDRLLAKSCEKQNAIAQAALLPQHLVDVYEAALAVLEASGDDQLQAVGLEPKEWSSPLRRIVLLSAALHDLGKANDHFQKMIRGLRTQPQGLRHEWVTYWLLQETDLGKWLSPALNGSAEWNLVLWAIVGHHPRYDRPTPPQPLEGGGSQLLILLEHADFLKCLDWISGQFSLGQPPALTTLSLNLAATAGESPFSVLNRAFAQHTCAWKQLDTNHRLLAAVCKACLLGVDVSGSALIHSALPCIDKTTWIRTSLQTHPAREDLESLVRERLKGQPQRLFQRQVAEQQGRVALVRAGCGTGKTLAAYLRAAQQWHGKRIYFCYPTTATATEGFRGYLFDPESGHCRYGARLFHSRAATDSEMILHAAGDEDPTDELWRSEALCAWSTPIVSCTVDTVLGLLQNQRRGLFAWPALAQSAFVFDEIHAYDNRLFRALLRFLQALRGVPILLMTASLPTARRHAIEASLASVGEKLTEVSGPPEIENLARYHLLQGLDPFQAVRDELRREGKVLWVCNTVARAMESVAKLAEYCPLVYHSRFRYEDRVARHAEVVTAFERQHGGPVIAVCTQVAEMSLDISASMLVTELAPVPALIQRLGRLNRWAMPPIPGQPAPPTRPFLVIEPLDDRGSLATAPYDTDDLGDWPAVARSWLEALGTEGISQSALASAWQKFDTGEAPSPSASPWLDGGPETRVDATRDASPGITVILEGHDSNDVQTGRKPPVQVAIPMPPPPRRLAWQHWGRVRGYPVAPADFITYDPKWGASWREK